MPYTEKDIEWFDKLHDTIEDCDETAEIVECVDCGDPHHVDEVVCPNCGYEEDGDDD